MLDTKVSIRYSLISCCCTFTAPKSRPYSPCISLIETCEAPCASVLLLIED